MGLDCNGFTRASNTCIGGRIEKRERNLLAQKIISGLEAIHDVGIAHMDLKDLVTAYLGVYFLYQINLSYL
mgnify:CR=1 FL=1